MGTAGTRVGVLREGVAEFIVVGGPSPRDATGAVVEAVDAVRHGGPLSCPAPGERAAAQVGPRTGRAPSRPGLLDISAGPATSRPKLLDLSTGRTAFRRRLGGRT